jgi:hypothetical protein
MVEKSRSCTDEDEDGVDNGTRVTLHVTRAKGQRRKERPETYDYGYDL